MWRLLRSARRFGVGLLSSPSDRPRQAFDLTAEGFAAALASVPRFKPGPEPPQAWLFAIARHKLSEASRRDRVQDEARRALAMEPLELHDEALEILETANGTALDLLETLAPEQRDAIKAHHLDQRDYADIAAELRRAESVIRKRVSRASCTAKLNFETEKRDERSPLPI